MSDSLGSVVIGNGDVNTDIRTPFSNSQLAFFNITVEGGIAIQSTANIAVTNQLLLRSNAYIRSQDTLDIQTENTHAITGGGKIIAGTIRRSIASGTPGVYRFESESTYVSYRSGGSILPTSVSMTSFPDVEPASDSGWVSRGGVVDTTTHSIRADEVQAKKGKWAIGVPHLIDEGGTERTVFISRIYAYATTGDNSAPATLSFRYEPEELHGLPEWLLQLFFSENPTVSVQEGKPDVSGLHPKVFALYQNFPNPFNPTTIIRYDLPVESFVILKIFNILGQEVKTLLNEVQPAGYRSTTWNGTNRNGAAVASGVYLYTLEAKGHGSHAEQFYHVQKAIMIR